MSFYGVSPHFRIVEDGEETPVYDVKIQQFVDGSEEGKIEVRFSVTFEESK